MSYKKGDCFVSGYIHSHVNHFRDKNLHKNEIKERAKRLKINYYELIHVDRFSVDDDVRFLMRVIQPNGAVGTISLVDSTIRCLLYKVDYVNDFEKSSIYEEVKK